MTSVNNSRIAKNTLLLYIRMLLVMGVTLFTSRVILEALGVEDYGIYNVVGGLSSALIFFSSTLTTSTQRFLNFELGKGNLVKVKKIFNTCLLIFISIAILVLLIGATGGKWFVEYKLVIPNHQRDAAVIVLYATLLSICSTFIFSVYESVLIAHENMKIYAYLGIFDAFAKLGVTYLIYIVSDKLIVYAWLLFAVQIIPKLVLAIYCHRKYTEVRHQLTWDTSLFKELVGFTGWNIYGSTVWMFNGQGINILLNMSFGPIVNAANGIAHQVNNAVTNFSSNFFTAARPQIIKSFATGEYQALINLIYSSSRFSCYLLWALSLPIMLRSEQILSIWLIDVPEYTSVFVQWVLIYSIVNSFNNPIWTAMTATGNIKRPVLIGSNLFLLAFPLSYIALKLGMQPQFVFLFLSLGRVAFLATTIFHLSKYVQISFKTYFSYVLLPISKVLGISFLTGYIVNSFLPQNLISLFIIIICTIFMNVMLIYILGITEAERNGAKNIISNLRQKLK